MYHDLIWLCCIKKLLNLDLSSFWRAYSLICHLNSFASVKNRELIKELVFVSKVTCLSLSETIKTVSLSSKLRVINLGSEVLPERLLDYLSLPEFVHTAKSHLDFGKSTVLKLLILDFSKRANRAKEMRCQDRKPGVGKRNVDQKESWTVQNVNMSHFLKRTFTGKGCEHCEVFEPADITLMSTANCLTILSKYEHVLKGYSIFNAASHFLYQPLQTFRWGVVRFLKLFTSM